MNNPNRKSMQGGVSGFGGSHGRGGGPKPKDAKAAFLRLLRYIGTNKIIFVVIIVAMIISSLANVASSYFLKPLIDNYILPMSKQALELNQVPDFIPLLIQLFIIGAIMLVGIVAVFVANRLAVNLSANIIYRIRTDMYEKMQKLPVKFFDSRPHGEIMSRYINDANTLSQMFSTSIPQLIWSLISIVGVFCLMVYLSWQLTLLVFVMFGLYFIVLKTIGARSAKYFREQQKETGVVNGYLEEMIEGQKVVKVFGREGNIAKEFAVQNDALRKASANANIYANVLMPIMGNLSYLHYAMTAAVGAVLAIGGHIQIGAVVAFLQSTRQFSMPLTQISTQANSMLMALAGAERIFELLDSEPETDDGFVTLVNAIENSDGSFTETTERTPIWVWKNPKKEGKEQLIKLRGDVVFENVTFGYDENKTVLKNISLYAKPGQRIALVGSTGAGKTTITNLLNRFYDIKEGRILYDGIDIKDIKKADLRRSLGMVLQDTHLFTGTVTDNIRYGRLDASDEEVFTAAKTASADSFIKHLPEGYATVLSGDGSNLSQGQRQLLSIARTAVADPPVLVLDEATSSIDTRTELLIEKGMNKLMEGRTVFVIAHRLSTVRSADAILVLEQGEIIERGSHEDLLAQKGKYYQLYTGMFELE